MRLRIISAKSNRNLLFIFVPLLLIALISLAVVYYLTPPKHLVMTTGFEGGAYANFGERYRQILAREKIKVEVIVSSGSVENLRHLNNKSSPVEAVLCRTGPARHLKKRIWFPSGPSVIPRSGFFIEARRHGTIFLCSKEGGLRSDRRGAGFANLPWIYSASAMLRIHPPC